jgi:VanZ family protein
VTKVSPPARGRRLVHLAWLCLPLAAWLAVIALASTDVGKQANSDPLLLRLIHLLFPGSRGGPSTNDFDALSWALRKTAHLVEYAVLALLATRALRGLFPNYAGTALRRGHWKTFWKAAVLVLPFGAVVAAVDEFHQSFVASRTASPWDALIDVLGLVLGLTIAWLIWRRRRSKASTPGA